MKITSLVLTAVLLASMNVFAGPGEIGSARNRTESMDQVLEDARRFKAERASSAGDWNQAMDEFAQGLMTKFNAKSCVGKKMYQTNFNVYSVSETVEIEAKDKN